MFLKTPEDGKLESENSICFFYRLFYVHYKEMFLGHNPLL